MVNRMFTTAVARYAESWGIVGIPAVLEAYALVATTQISEAIRCRLDR
jgi:hypothetical protein